MTPAEAAAASTPSAVSSTFAASDTPATALNALTGTRVDAAIASGMSPAQAQQAGGAYSEALIQLLNQGVPMSEAMARAEQVFQAEAAFPASSPQDAAGMSLSSGGGDVASQLATLAGAESAAGSAAFDQVLATALSNGMSFAEAVATAQAAAQQADAMARADATPQSALASGGGAGSASIGGSPAFQNALSALLASGVPLEQALQRAGQIAMNDAMAADADAHSPASALASGNLAALPQGMEGGSFDLALQAALAKGYSLEEAMARAMAIDAFERRVLAAEARNPASGISTGSMLPPVIDAAFDRALANAIARGESPEQALESARRASAQQAAAMPTAATALASGENLEALLYLVGSSRMYRLVLGNSLARGLTIEESIARAKKAERANAFRFPLPPQVAKNVPVSGNGLRITIANGKPLPSWLVYFSPAREFFAVEVPDGALPMPVLISVGARHFNIVISEGPVH